MLPRCLLLIVTAAAMASISNSSLGQDESATWPARTLSPWTLYNIDPREHVQIKASLETSWKELVNLVAKENLPEPVERSATLNKRRLLKRYAFSQPTASGRPLLVAPILCGFFDHALLMVTASDAATGELIALRHRLIVPSDRETFRNFRAASSSPALGAEALTRDVLAAASASDAKASHSLHVGIASAARWSRPDETASHCLDMLLAGRLVELGHVTVDPLSEEHRAALRPLFKDHGKRRRATRTLVTRWQRAAKIEKRALPMAFDLSVTLGESVFGSPLDERPSNHSLTFAARGDQLGFALPEALTERLTTQRERLRHDEAPQISKIRGAWVYLDRGRAWGLRMDDRLIVRGEGTEPIAGHVVGFYGPGLKVQSPRGFPVEEGAIVFIRNGQRQVALGMTMDFDPKTYPPGPDSQ